MTGRDLVSASLRLIGVIAPGESLGSNEASDALSALNRMIASWSTESLLINARATEVFTLVASQQRYSMGSGGDFNTTRPVMIETASLRVVTATPNIDLPIEIISKEQWAAILTKTVTSNIQTVMYVEGTYPLEYVNLWPEPAYANSLVLYSWKQLTSIATLDTAISLPPGYEDALVYNLALRLSPEYGKSAPDLVVMTAAETKATIKRINTKPMLLRMDSALAPAPKTFNWITGGST